MILARLCRTLGRGFFLLYRNQDTVRIYRPEHGFRPVYHLAYGTVKNRRLTALLSSTVTRHQQPFPTLPLACVHFNTNETELSPTSGFRSKGPHSCSKSLLELRSNSAQSLPMIYLLFLGGKLLDTGIPPCRRRHRSKRYRRPPALD